MTTTPKRRWFRFSLRTLFVVLMTFGIWLGWQRHIVRERGNIRIWIEQNQGFANLEDQRYSLDPPTIPFWRHWFGDEPLASIALRDGWVTDEQEARVKCWFPEAYVYIYLYE